MRPSCRWLKPAGSCLTKLSRDHEILTLLCCPAAGPAAISEAAAGLDLGPVRAFLAHMRHADVEAGPESAAWVERGLQAARELSPGTESRLVHCWLSVRSLWQAVGLSSCAACLAGLCMCVPLRSCVLSQHSGSSCELLFALQVARLVALSHGQTVLREEHWQQARHLEHQRIERQRLVRQVGKAWLCWAGRRRVLTAAWPDVQGR